MVYILDIIKKIVFFMIISNIMINLVNNESYKKYIKIYTGIFFIVIVISSIDNVSDVFSYDKFNKNSDNTVSEKYKEIIFNNLSNHITNLNAKVVEVNIDDNYEIKSVYIIAYDNNTSDIKETLSKYYLLSEQNIRIESAYGNN